MGLRSAQDEDEIVNHIKENIEQKLMKNNRKHFSKVKDSKVCEDIIHMNMINDNVREKYNVENLIEKILIKITFIDLFFIKKKNINTRR